MYAFFGYEHLDILYNKSVSLFVSQSHTFVGIFPNLLQYISGGSVWMFWSSLFTIAPFILFRSTSLAASLSLWYILACFVRISPLTGNIGTQTVLMILVFSAFVAIPKKRTDVDQEHIKNNVYTNKLLYFGLWFTFIIYYFYSGYTKIITYAWQSGQALVHFELNPLMRGGLISEMYSKIPVQVEYFLTYFVAIGELLTPLAFISSSFRKIVWCIVLVIQLGLLICMNLSDIQMIMIIFSFIVFDPAWIPSDKKYQSVVTLYYDGHCALCHHFIKHVINIDHQDRITFKEIAGSSYQKKGEDFESFVVVYDNKVLQKVDALILVYRVSGGLFRIVAFFINLVPKQISNYAYDYIAKNRYTIFGQVANICPVVDKTLAKKFK